MTFRELFEEWIAPLAVLALIGLVAWAVSVGPAQRVELFANPQPLPGVPAIREADTNADDGIEDGPGVYAAAHQPDRTAQNGDDK
jgi:hypothetical protein